ncbi:hypothetical protein BZM27_26665 [Paraburkholderia steynii]|uniref:Uncharacterized protein n=1 Tax=Paraburkholderia steynii TaxID=1245441 RepID=A0A4R0XF25_9BURK|nr:hypothetical protein BZM27_26665 [Paraburkholderia steynii]
MGNVHSSSVLAQRELTFRAKVCRRIALSIGGFVLCERHAGSRRLEMGTPLDGVVRVSVEPMREALSRLGT